MIYFKTSPRRYHGVALKIKNQLLLGVIITLLIGGLAILAGLIIRIARPENSDDTFLHVAIWTLAGILISSFLTLRLLSRSLKSISQVEQGIIGLADTRGPVIPASSYKKLNCEEPLDEAYVHLLERLDKAEDQHQEFLSLICHQVRSPMATIMNYTELINDPAFMEDDEFLQQASKIILDQGQRICQFTDDVLTAASLDAKRLNLKMELFHLGPFVEQTVREARIETRQDIHFDNQMGDVVIWGDALRMRQALIKLIEKCRNGQAAGPPVSVKLRTSESPDIVEIPVTDQANRISNQEKVLIAQHFQRKHARPQDIHGSWLGLFVANSIIRSHRGSISIEDGPDEGSTFTVKLPVADEWQTLASGNKS